MPHKLIGPALPYMALGAVASMLNCGLRGVFHSIGNWGTVLELAAEGRRAEALQAVFALFLGHIFIECVDCVDNSSVRRARIIFTRRVKHGVLGALLSQDYAYFDRHEPGVLQDRLNRDSSELGDNLINFPQRVIHRVMWILVNVAFVVALAPRALLVPAACPLLVTLPLQYYCFRANRQRDRRQSKAQERAVAATSEVLREVRTVRQFAMEPAEVCRYAESEGALADVEECMTTSKELTDLFFW